MQTDSHLQMCMGVNWWFNQRYCWYHSFASLKVWLYWTLLLCIMN